MVCLFALIDHHKFLLFLFLWHDTYFAHWDVRLAQKAFCCWLCLWRLNFQCLWIVKFLVILSVYFSLCLFYGFFDNYFILDRLFCGHNFFNFWLKLFFHSFFCIHFSLGIFKCLYLSCDFYIVERFLPGFNLFVLNFLFVVKRFLKMTVCLLYTSLILK